jgi:hypothetical protein
MDHSVESVVVFQSQSREKTDAKIQVYEDALAQQIATIDVARTSGDSAASKASEAPPTMDEVADILIVNPLKAGAESIGSAPGSNFDFLLTAQLSRAVKPKAYRIASGVTGSDDLESLAFRNPDGTYVLFTALFAWDPKSQLVSLVPRESRNSAKDSLSIEAKCSKLSPLGIDLRCESHAFQCSIFPVRFICNRQPGSVILSLTVYSAGENNLDRKKPGFVTITATPDVGEPTSLRVPCCSAGDKKD